VEVFNTSYMGAIFKTARKRAGLTQEQVAEQVDITPRFLMGLEKGEKRPSLEVLLRLAHLLNIPGDALIHPQLSFVDKEDQELLRLFMELTARESWLQSTKCWGIPIQKNSLSKVFLFLPMIIFKCSLSRIRHNAISLMPPEGQMSPLVALFF